MKKLRVIQIGTGHDHAPGIAESIRFLSDVYVFVGIVEENEALRKKAETNEVYKDLPFFTWEEALAQKPDAFFVETEEHELVGTAIRAIEAGYHVHMDKPGSENSEEFHRLCELAKAKKLELSLGYMYRHHIGVLYAKEMVDTGRIGELISVEAHMSLCYDKEKREWLSKFKGGMMYFLGCHLIDLVVQFRGFPDEIIPFNSKTMVDGVDSVDYGFAVLKYKNGVSFVKTNCNEPNGQNRRQLVVSGRDGTIEIRPLEIPTGLGTDTTYIRATLDGKTDSIDNSNKIHLGPQRRYERMLRKFALYIQGEEENPFTYDYEAKLHDLILKACE